MELNDLKLAGKNSPTQIAAFNYGNRQLIQGADSNYSIVIYYKNRTYLYKVDRKEMTSTYRTSTPGNCYVTFCDKSKISYKIAVDFVSCLNAERFKQKKKYSWNTL